MLGPAELREIHEAMTQAGSRPGPAVGGPYLSPAFAAGLALTRALGLPSRRPVSGGGGSD